jgi:hypothetical protein
VETEVEKDKTKDWIAWWTTASCCCVQISAKGAKVEPLVSADRFSMRVWTLSIVASVKLLQLLRPSSLTVSKMATTNKLVGFSIIQRENRGQTTNKRATVNEVQQATKQTQTLNILTNERNEIRVQKWR